MSDVKAEINGFYRLVAETKRRTTTAINICHNFQLVELSLDAVAPTLFTIGSGSLIGFLAGFAIKRIFKILAVIVGIFFAVYVFPITELDKCKLG